MSGVVKIGYGYKLEDGTVLLSREGVEAYIKHFLSDLADAPRSATVTAIDDDFNVTYVVDPADCTVCYENDIENNDEFCTNHVLEYELETEVIEIWDKVTVIS